MQLQQLLSHFQGLGAVLIVQELHHTSAIHGRCIPCPVNALQHQQGRVFAAKQVETLLFHCNNDLWAGMQDDAHIFCLPDQITREIIGVLDMVEQMMGSFGFTRLEVSLMHHLSMNSQISSHAQLGYLHFQELHEKQARPFLRRTYVRHACPLVAWHAPAIHLPSLA